jgi:heat shock protein HslJ
MKKILSGREAGILAATLVLTLTAACGSRETGNPSPTSPAQAGADSAAPTGEEMGNATYRGLEAAGGPLTLVNSHWEGPAANGGASRPEVSLVRGLHVTGDLDGDGRNEAAALLNESSGGSGTFTYLAVAGRRKGRVVNLGTALLGDRVQIRGMKIRDGRLFVDLVQPGPEDAACCPGELATRGWALEGKGSGEVLTEFVSTAKTGRLSLDTISGTRWVLRDWDLDSPAPSLPEVTLQYEEGRLAGNGGCNRYFATVSQGPSAGDLSLGPVGATRMGCPDAVMAVESRYLGLLGNVKKFGFVAGKLALSYENDESVGVLLFEAAPKQGT